MQDIYLLFSSCY